MTTKTMDEFLLPLGEGGAARRMRATRPTISFVCRIVIVGRASLTRRCRATLSQRERAKAVFRYPVRRR